jgi:fatty-acyl-CoA synthase
MEPKATETMAVGRLLKNAAVRYRDKEALYCSTSGRRFSYWELNERANRLANGLMDLGLKKGDMVAFLITNRSEIIETFFAIGKTGLVGLPLNYRLIAKEIVQMITLTDAKILIFEDTFAQVAEYVRQQLPGIKTFIGIGKGIPDFATNYDKLISNASPNEPNVEIREEDDYYMNLTSGTTGLPKSYMLNHYNNAGVIIDVTAMYKVTEDDVVMIVFPMFGRVGYAWMGAAIYNGAKQVIVNFEPKKVLEIIQSEKVTISNWVAPMANFILSVPEFDKISPNIYEFYGLQETAIIINGSIKDKIKKPASIGKVSPWAEVRIVDASGNDVPTGAVGEVIARALGGTTSYYKNEEKTKETFKNGWCHTGDLGYFDEEGYFYISGRIKDMIVTGGQNVFSAEVENVLVAHPAVADCTVIGLPDEKWGEAVTAVIVKKSGVEVTEADIMAFCKKEMAGFKVPKRIIWYEGQIPRTPTGKVTKFVLVEKFSKQ